MHASRPAPSSADVAMEVASLSAGLGVLTLPLFPLALPALILVVGPLLPVALAGALLAIPFVVPIWLARAFLRARARRRGRLTRGGATAAAGY
jgi:membrane protein implicated in regulation of membrane protease activity